MAIGVKLDDLLHDRRMTRLNVLPLRFHHRCTKLAILCFGAACHVSRSDGPRTYVST